MYMKDVDSGVCDRHLTMHITAPTLWRTPESHFHQYLSLLIHVNDWLDWTRLYNCLVCSHLLQATWRTQWSACMAYTKQIAGIVGVDKNRIMNETCILRRPGSTQSHRIFIATCTKYWHWKHPLPCKTLAPFTYVRWRGILNLSIIKIPRLPCLLSKVKWGVPDTCVGRYPWHTVIFSTDNWIERHPD